MSQNKVEESNVIGYCYLFATLPFQDQKIFEPIGGLTKAVLLYF